MSSRANGSSAAFLAVFACFALTALAPRTAAAQAGDGELVLTLGPAYAAVPHFAGDARGPATAMSAFYGLSSTLSLGMATSWTHLFPFTVGEERTGAQDVFSAFAGVGANIDILAVVPFVSLMVGAHRDDGALGDPGGMHWGWKAAMGLDYRIVRRWAVGAQLEWHGVAPQPLSYPDLSVVWFRFSGILDFRAL